MNTTATFPATLRHNGETFCSTGKLGHRIADGALAAEYESVTRHGFRVWRTEAGEVYGE